MLVLPDLPLASASTLSPTPPPVLAARATRAVLASHFPYILSVVFDEVADSCGVLSRLRTDVGNGAAEPDVVTHELGPVGVLEQVVDVLLAHAKPTIEVASIMRFVMISHVVALLESGATSCPHGLIGKARALTQARGRPAWALPVYHGGHPGAQSCEWRVR
jgi:hypothetical protein